MSDVFDGSAQVSTGIGGATTLMFSLQATKSPPTRESSTGHPQQGEMICPGRGNARTGLRLSR